MNFRLIAAYLNAVRSQRLPPNARMKYLLAIGDSERQPILPHILSFRNLQSVLSMT